MGKRVLKRSTKLWRENGTVTRAVFSAHKSLFQVIALWLARHSLVSRRLPIMNPEMIAHLQGWIQQENLKGVVYRSMPGECRRNFLENRIFNPFSKHFRLETVKLLRVKTCKNSLKASVLMNYNTFSLKLLIK